MTPRQLFGEIAIRRGHITPQQLDRALEIQKQLRKRSEKKLIGMVMLERGMITNDQLIDILRCIEIIKVAAPGILPGRNKGYQPRPAI
jgi:hypothetical protein